MRPIRQNSTRESGVSRRSVLAGIAGTTLTTGVMAAAAQPAADPSPTQARTAFDGFGVPTAAHTEDPKKIRAALTLWLLLTTGKNYFPVTSDSSATPPVTCLLDTTSLANDLAHLPGGTEASRVALINKLMQVAQTGTFNRNVNVGGNVVGAQISYATALSGIRDLFQSFGLGQLASTGAAAANEASYVPTDHSCPHSIDEVLSIATNHVTTKEPPAV